MKSFQGSTFEPAGKAPFVLKLHTDEGYLQMQWKWTIRNIYVSKPLTPVVTAINLLKPTARLSSPAHTVILCTDTMVKKTD